MPNPLPGSKRDLQPSALYDAEAEKAVLGCMMAQPAEVIDEVAEVLSKDDFFVPANQEIFACLTTMHHAGQAIDVMLVHGWLQDRKLADRVGSPGILAELLVGFATHLNVGSYATRVRDKSLLRCLQSACSSIAQDIADLPDSVPAVLDRAESLIMAVTASGLATTHASAPGAVMDAELGRIIAYDGKREIQGIPSGFHQLDQLTGGWKPEEMIVLAARPGVGKTALALAFAHAAAQHKYYEADDRFRAPGHSVGIITLEMPESQLDLRRLSMKSGIPLQKLRIGLTDNSERQTVVDARETLRSYPIVTRDRSFLTINQLRSLARKMFTQFAIELLIIDYLQLIAVEGKAKAENRQNDVAHMSKSIKSLAKELKIPIIILAQLNRDSEKMKREPELHNLRESGAIEQDADVVLLLHRHEPDKDDGNERTSPVLPYSLKLAKQRNGPTDTIPINFHTTYARFDDPIRRL